MTTSGKATVVSACCPDTKSCISKNPIRDNIRKILFKPSCNFTIASERKDLQPGKRLQDFSVLFSRKQSMKNVSLAGILACPVRYLPMMPPFGQNNSGFLLRKCIHRYIELTAPG